MVRFILATRLIQEYSSRKLRLGLEHKRLLFVEKTSVSSSMSSEEPVDACGDVVLLAAVGAPLQPRQRRLVLLVAVRRAVVGVHRDRQLAAGGQPVGHATDVVGVLRTVERLSKT